ncbi:hypothetical protein M3Y99_00038900 [Aphelenchoides fujianensis]|nr:hypothetical protein M3Y99_00038900 [Aphelenchoides fujianensis]
MAPALSCFPSCEVSLPEIGSAAVRSKFDACQIPPVLSISVKTDGKLTFGTRRTPLVHEPNAYLLSPHYFTDERLAVIAEVDEKDQLSVNSSSGVESGSNPPRSASAEPRKLSGDSGASFGPVVHRPEGEFSLPERFAK